MSFSFFFFFFFWVLPSFNQLVVKDFISFSKKHMNGNGLTWKNYGIKDLLYSQPVFTCSKSTMEKAQLWVKHVDDKHTRTSDVFIINFEKI